jgi:hypothetical protein
MVHVSIQSDRLRLDVEGWDKLWAFMDHLEVPLAQVREVRADPAAARGFWHGWKSPGTQIPGVITAGTYYQGGHATFYDVHDPQRAIVIELEGGDYRRLVVEVEHPAEVVTRLQAAIARRAT